MSSKVVEVTGLLYKEKNFNPTGSMKFVDLTNNVTATVSFDAQSSVTVTEGASIRVKQHENFVHLIHPKGYDYFEIIRSKLHWGQKV